MRLVKSHDTKPELQLRRLVWTLGYRYRKNRRDIIGLPDMAFIERKLAIFMHGCFWHRHCCYSGRRKPKSRCAFWNAKFEKNVRRDKQVKKALKAAGWRSLVIWECEMRYREMVERRIRKFMDA